MMSYRGWEIKGFRERLCLARTGYKERSALNFLNQYFCKVYLARVPSAPRTFPLPEHNGKKHPLEAKKVKILFKAL